MGTAMHESAGRQDRGREAARQQMADAMLVEAADSVGRMKGTSIWPPGTLD